MPTFDEIIQDLNIAKIFNKRDLTPGYHQLELVKNQDTSPPLKPMLELINTSDKILEYRQHLKFFQESIRSVIQRIYGARTCQMTL